MNSNAIVNFFSSLGKGFDIKQLEEIEEYLIQSGVHVDIVSDIMNHIVSKLTIGQIKNKKDMHDVIYNKIISIMKPFARPIDLDQKNKPHVMMIFGINGSGKTTTTGKMVSLLSSLGWSVVLAACDTFRAAAKEQLEHWSRVPNVSIVCRDGEGESPARIAVKAVQNAIQNKIDIVIIDTAGRVHNNTNLVLELMHIKSKIAAVVRGAPHQNIMILDANCGYNAIHQVETFHYKIGIHGIVLTKIDIAQKLGIVMSICKKYKLPIYGITDGETKENIRDFNVKEFANIILKDIKLL